MEIDELDYDELMHYGRKGMKWGQHIYGSDKKSGSSSRSRKKRKSSNSKVKDFIEKRRASKKQKKASEKMANRSVKSMSMEELLEQTRRLEAERNYLELKSKVSALEPKKISKGKAFVSHVGNNILKPSLTDASKKALSGYLDKQIKEALGIKPDPMEALKKEVNYLEMLQKKAKAEDYFEKRNAKKEKSNSTSNKSQSDSSKSKSDIFDGIYETPNSSKKTNSNNDNDNVVEAEWYEVPVNDPAVVELKRIGQQYIAGLLEEPK